MERAGPYFRAGQKITVYVNEELKELIPGYLNNRWQEVAELRQLSASHAFASIMQVGHRMKGIGSSYGFEVITRFGEELEEYAKQQDLAAIDKVIERYNYYLKIIEIRFRV